MRTISTIATVAGLCIAAFAGGREGDRDQSSEQVPELHIEVTESRVRISGLVSSFAHEAILRQTLLRKYSGRSADVRLTVAPALPPGWALVTELALAAMAETTSGEASINPTGIDIRAITTNESRWPDVASRLAQNLLPAMHFNPQVEEISRAGPLARQCLELFRTAMRGRKIEFAISSAKLRSSSAPVLDELVQIATDCPDGRIEITGHTDSSGNEMGNLALSQSRADAVAAYFAEAGIDPERVAATGVGSSRPIANGDDTRARRLNRRIEIDIRFP